MNLSRYSMRTTASHVYFWGGPFSQWFRSDEQFECSFEAELPMLAGGPDGSRDRLARSGRRLVFSSAEKYMMAAKASIFGDVGPGGTLERIMSIHDCRTIKAIGREVPGLAGGKWDDRDRALWDRACMAAVTIGNYSKFSQSDGLHGLMTTMEGRRFVEGSPKDDIWGVKLSWNDPAIEDERNWRGKNRLGTALDGTAALLAEFGRAADPFRLLAARAAADKTAPKP
jgi:ribA/ribD-fused uncharacterized protein